MRILYGDLWKGKTLTDSSEQTSYPGANTQDPRLSRSWRPSTLASEWVKIDAGAAGIAIDSIAIVGHNLTAAATVAIQGNAADAWGAPTINLAPTIAPLIIQLFALTTLEWWRILISDPTNPAGYINIGRVFACAHWESAEDCEAAFQPGAVDSTLVSHSITGQVSSDLGVRQRTYKFSMGGMKDPTKRSLEAISAAVGLWDPIVLAPSDGVTSPGVLGINPLYCNFMKIPTFTQVGQWLWTDDTMQFEEAL